MTELDGIYRNLSLKMALLSLSAAIAADFVALKTPIHYFLPDFSALLLLFWALHRPQTFGVGLAFVLGILMDIGTLSPLGQHALAFVWGVFMMRQNYRQVRLYSFGLQALVVLALMLMMHGILLLIVSIHQSHPASFVLLIAPFISSLLWPLLSNIMLSLSQLKAKGR